MTDRTVTVQRLKERSFKEGFVESTFGHETFMFRKGQLVVYERKVFSLNEDDKNEQLYKVLSKMSKR